MPNGIGWAVKQMQDGARVYRAGWNGRGMWVELQTPDAGSKMTEPYVFLSYVRNGPALEERRRIPWLCSQADLLATDWDVLI